MGEGISSCWDGMHLLPAKINVGLAGRGNTQVDTPAGGHLIPLCVDSGEIKQGLQAPLGSALSIIKVNAPE